MNVAEGATAVVTLAATDTDTADTGGLDYAIVTDDCYRYTLQRCTHITDNACTGAFDVDSDS